MVAASSFAKFMGHAMMTASSFEKFATSGISLLQCNISLFVIFLTVIHGYLPIR